MFVHTLSLQRTPIKAQTLKCISISSPGPVQLVIHCVFYTSPKVLLQFHQMRYVNLSLLHNIENSLTELHGTTLEFVIIPFNYLNFLQDAQEEDSLDSLGEVKSGGRPLESHIKSLVVNHGVLMSTTEF